MPTTTVLITGASSGIGYDVARGFLEKGANVVLNGRNADKLSAAAESLSAVCGKLSQMCGSVSRGGGLRAHVWMRTPRTFAKKCTAFE